MQTFSHPAMPMFSYDHAAYMRNMHDWHMKMTHYHEQQKAFHTDRAKQFQQMMGRVSVSTNTPLEEQTDIGAA